MGELVTVMGMHALSMPLHQLSRQELAMVVEMNVPTVPLHYLTREELITELQITVLLMPLHYLAREELITEVQINQLSIPWTQRMVQYRSMNTLPPVLSVIESSDLGGNPDDPRCRLRNIRFLSRSIIREQ